MNDELTLVVGGREWAGWQRVSVTRSMDTVPANFEIQVTERYPNMPDISIAPGDPCQVRIGGDLVITGYVDRYVAVISAREHTVRIAGRSKSADLVDCSAFVGDKEAPQYQIMGGTTLSIAQELAKPYDVEVASVSGPGAEIPRFNINLGETPWEIIDRITRYSSLIAYDMPDGSVRLAQAGSEKMGSGFVQGENVETASVNFTMDSRFSEYEGFLTSSMAFTTQGQMITRGEMAYDRAVPRFRRKIIISEQTNLGTSMVAQRVQWECNRRIGRSQAVTVQCDSWRDTGGQLWAPNHLAPIRIPALKLPDASWTIGSITYARDEQGQRGIVLLMPASAFQPEPSAFAPLPLTAQDVGAVNPAARE